MPVTDPDVIAVCPDCGDEFDEDHASVAMPGRCDECADERRVARMLDADADIYDPQW